MDLFDRDDYNENMRNRERLEWPDDNIFGEQIPGQEDETGAESGDEDVMGIGDDDEDMSDVGDDDKML